MARPQAPVGAPKESAPDADYRARLLALRDRLEAAVAGAGDRELAPLTARYVDVLERIAALPNVTEASDLDDLAARRARGSASARTKRPAAG